MTQPLSLAPNQPLLLYDGVCGLCDQLVQFTIRHDQPGQLRYAALQSPTGQALLARFNLPTEQYSSAVLVIGDRAYTESRAVIGLLRHLDWPYRLGLALIAVPPPLANLVYRWVARHRYQWFGQADQCRLPTPAVRARFLS